MSLPNPEPVFFLIEAFRRSQALFTAVDLKIFDALEDGAQGVGQLADRIEANPDALERLLSTCVHLGLLDKEGELYRNPPLASVYLCRRSPQALVGYIEYSQRALWALWAKLPDAVREGTNRWEQVFGGQGELFSHYYTTEEDKRRFVMGMHAFGLISSPRVVRAFDLSGFHRLVDLGGATGHLPIAACEVYPRLAGCVFDLPKVLNVTEEIVAGAGLSGRITTAGGDFFTDPLPEADLYSLGRILHDWGEEKCRLLLSRVHEALPAGGGLLIAEKVLDESGVRPLWALLQSLNMLVVTEGKERKLSEYERLLRAAGFSSVEAVVLEDSPLDAILARKNSGQAGG
ncbi:MAG: class I SAM-dependent methyltransferase [Acidobacteriota bacterium]